MGQSRTLGMVLVAVAVAMIALAPTAMAEERMGTHLIEDVYTQEQTTVNRDMVLEGDRVLEAWFNFSVNEDKINSNPDSFLFTVTNMDDPTLSQNLPGTTDVEGRLRVPIRITLEGSPRWRVSVTCTEAGDTMLGPRVIEEDAGNAWDLQVEYVYVIDDGTNGNGGPDNGGDGDDQPLMLSLLHTFSVLMALASLLVAFLSLNTFTKGGGSLKFPLVLAFLLALGAFFFLPVALLVNLELYNTLLAGPPLGSNWLGNLALLLFVLWVVPFIIARKRVMGSDEVHGVLSRITAKRAADAVRARAERFPADPVPDRMLALLMVVIAIASAVIAAMMRLA